MKMAEMEGVSERLKRDVIDTHQRMSNEISHKQEELNRVNSVATSLQVALQDSGKLESRMKL
jgi:hypothetical protein